MVVGSAKQLGKNCWQGQKCTILTARIAVTNQMPGAPPPPLEPLELDDGEMLPDELELEEEELLEDELELEEDELLLEEEDEELELPDSWTTALLLVTEPAELETITR